MTAKTPKDYRCLTCNAEPGEPCKRPSGHAVPFGDYHAGRKKMWSFFHGDETWSVPGRKPETEGTLF